MSETNKTLEIIKKNKIVVVVRGVEENKIIDTCKALLKGGIKCIEITFNQSSPTCNEDTEKALKLIKEKFGEEICLGAGTVLTTEQVEVAVKAGAKYIISPNFDEEVVKRTKELNVVSMPAGITPSEIINCYKAGADVVKLFPLGKDPVSYIKAIKAPISHIPLSAVGGVNQNNIQDIMACGIGIVGLGSNLVDINLINESKYDEITSIAKKYVELANTVD